jgi:hypothetical protein
MKDSKKICKAEFARFLHVSAAGSVSLVTFVTQREFIAANQNFRVLSAGNKSPKYQGSGIGHKHQSAVRIKSILFLLSPCLRGAKVLSFRFSDYAAG